MTDPIIPKTNDEIKSEFEKVLLLLTDQKNRTDKDPLNQDQRKQILNEIYDSCLISLQYALLEGTHRGTAAMTTLMERTRKELESIENPTNSKSGSNITLTWSNTDDD